MAVCRKNTSVNILEEKRTMLEKKGRTGEQVK